MRDFSALSTHRYRVRLPGSLSADRPREGFLLRVEWPGREAGLPTIRGYADLMSWPELGDLPIEDELRAILRGVPTTLGARALEMAALDAEARATDRSLWKGVGEPPESHFLAGALHDLELVDFGALAKRGFRSIKVKCSGGKSIDSGRSALARATTKMQKHDLRLRIDFNGSADAAFLDSLLSGLSQEQLDRIEFLEDPLPSDQPRAWLDLRARFPQLALFVDRAGEEDRELLALADGWVLKPALQGEEWLKSARREGGTQPLAFTQYLGHALGAAWAAWHAASTGSLARTSGLLFDSLIEGESAFFSEAVPAPGCRFETRFLRAGTGIGWTDEDFDSLTWSPWR